ncbi:MAG: hypothetical protein QW728_06130 [Thermoplasmata archaeon]
MFNFILYGMIALIVFLILLYLIYLNLQRDRRVLAELSSELGLIYDPGSFLFKWAKAGGKFRDRDVITGFNHSNSLTNYFKVSHRSRYIQYPIEVIARKPLSLNLSFFNEPGIVEIKTGDIMFDQSFIVKTRYPPEALYILNPPMRAYIMQLFSGLSAYSTKYYRRLIITLNEVEFYPEAYILNTVWIKNTLILLTDIAATVEMPNPPITPNYGIISPNIPQYVY